MLRVHSKASAKDLPGMHDSKYSLGTSALHCLGQTSLQVSLGDFLEEGLLKFCFSQLFGEEDPDQDVSPDTEDPEAAGNAGKEALENKGEDGVIKRTSTKQWAQEIGFDQVKLFNKFFNDDIQYLLSMGMFCGKFFGG